MEPALLVLLADDDADTRQLYALSLRMEGLFVELARDGVEALELAQARHPDVIVTDLVLPRLDGFALCGRLKEDSRTAAIPVIALTGYLRPAEDVRRAGFAAYLLKPIAPDALAARIREVLPTPLRS
jgi:CheY-like chemotaxis protein